MKRLYKFVYILFLAVLAVGCSDEEIIVPTGNYSPIRGGFPQGDSQEDSIIGEIRKEYGVYLLYKDITEQDLNRNWLSAGTGPVYVGGDTARAIRDLGVWSLPQSHLPFYVEFFSQHIFPNITVELAKTTLPVKIYMLDNLRGEPRKLGVGEEPEEEEQKPEEDVPGTSGGVKPISLRLGNFDNWAISFSTEDIFGNSTADHEEKMKVQRCKFIYRLISNAMEKGEIKVPEEFWEGFEFTEGNHRVDVNYDDPSVVNKVLRPGPPGQKPIKMESYKFNLGIVDFIYEGFGTATVTSTGQNIREGPMWYNPTSTKDTKHFKKDSKSFNLAQEYIKNALWLRHDDEKNEILERYPAQYTLIHEKFDIIIKMLDECGVNSQRIAAGK